MRAPPQRSYFCFALTLASLPVLCALLLRQWWKEGGLAVQTASPRTSNYVHTPYYSGGMVQLNNGTFMLEHCHGVIPLLLPFGLGDSIFSSMDLVTIYKSLTAYGRLTIYELFVNGKL